MYILMRKLTIKKFALKFLKNVVPVSNKGPSNALDNEATNHRKSSVIFGQWRHFKNAHHFSSRAALINDSHWVHCHRVFRVSLLKVLRMPRCCVAIHCSHSAQQLLEWPRDEDRARKWTKFVTAKRVNFSPVSTIVLCYKHFTDDCFANLMSYTQGFSKR